MASKHTELRPAPQIFPILGGVDQRKNPVEVEHEEFSNIQGTFPFYGGEQDRIFGKAILAKYNSPIYNIFQFWTPYGYAQQIFQYGDSIGATPWTTPQLQITIPSIPPSPGLDPNGNTNTSYIPDGAPADSQTGLPDAPGQKFKYETNTDYYDLANYVVASWKSSQTENNYVGDFPGPDGRPADLHECGSLSYCPNPAPPSPEPIVRNGPVLPVDLPVDPGGESGWASLSQYRPQAPVAYPYGSNSFTSGQDYFEDTVCFFIRRNSSGSQTRSISFYDLSGLNGYATLGKKIVTLQVLGSYNNFDGLGPQNTSIFLTPPLGYGSDFTGDFLVFPKQRYGVGRANFENGNYTCKRFGSIYHPFLTSEFGWVCTAEMGGKPDGLTIDDLTDFSPKYNLTFPDSTQPNPNSYVTVPYTLLIDGASIQGSAYPHLSGDGHGYSGHSSGSYTTLAVTYIKKIAV